MLRKMLSLYLGLILATLALLVSSRHSQAQEISSDDRTKTTLTFQEALESKLTRTEQETVRAEMKENGIAEHEMTGVRVTVDAEQKKLVVSGEAPSIRHLIFAGIELGSLFPVAVESVYMKMRGRDPLWSVDVRLEPSAYLNSISVAGAYHPFESAFFVGARLRQLFLHSPFGRGYDGETDSARGVGIESGFRWRLGATDSVLLSVSLGATKALSSVVDLPVMVNVNAGVAIRIFELAR